jgi:hypothetical protein
MIIFKDEKDGNIREKLYDKEEIINDKDSGFLKIEFLGYYEINNYGDSIRFTIIIHEEVKFFINEIPNITANEIDIINFYKNIKKVIEFLDTNKMII